MKQLAQVFRFLLRGPGTAGIATVILALGLALTMFMFGAINAYVIKPLPFPEAEQLVHIEMSNPAEGDDSIAVPVHDFLEWRNAQRTLKSVEGFYPGTINLSGSGTAERFDGAFITATAFSELGVQPFMGRLFLPGEDQPGAQPVVILGYSLWRDRFHSDAGIIGKTTRANGREAVIVGVMPPEFSFPYIENVWLPLSLDISNVKRGEGVDLEVFGRLREDISVAQAQADFRGIAEQIARNHPKTNAGLTAVVKPYAEEYIDRETRADLYSMFFAVVLVLVIACANVANLILVRAIARSREFAIRAALGAGRGHLMFQVIAECMLISVAGTALAIYVADYAGRWTMSMLKSTPEVAPPYWVRFDTDWRTIVFAAGMATVVALLAGLLPALRAMRIDLNESLRQSGYSVAPALGRGSRWLVTAQLALSLILLITAGLATRSVLNTVDIDIGARTDGFLTARIGLPESKYPDGVSRIRFYEELTTRLRAIPGVEHATVSSSLPATFVGSTYVMPEGAKIQNDRLPFAHQVIVDPDYFRTFQIPILTGRSFDSRDSADGQQVVIINRMLADRWWPNEKAVGRRLRLGRGEEESPWLTIVGVTPNVVQDEVDEPLAPAVYLPLSQNESRFMSVALLTRGNPLLLGESLRKTVKDLDPDLPVYWVRTLKEWIALGRFGTQFMATLFGIFALVALLLAAVGQYAVLAYNVRQRTREIGVRRALGAVDKAVLSLVLRQGFRQYIVALIIGLPLAVAFAFAIQADLFGVNPFDLLTYTVVPVLLLLISILAAIGPIQRALRVDPAQALRND